jgi:hypothetical protein
MVLQVFFDGSKDYKAFANAFLEFLGYSGVSWTVFWLKEFDFLSFFKNYKDKNYIITDMNFSNLMSFICNKDLIPLEAIIELKKLYDLLWVIN